MTADRMTNEQKGTLERLAREARPSELESWAVGGIERLRVVAKAELERREREMADRKVLLGVPLPKWFRS